METQVDYILIDMGRYSCVRDVRYFTGTICHTGHTDHNMVTEENG
jgi:hypothetical protein